MISYILKSGLAGIPKNFLLSFLPLLLLGTVSCSTANLGSIEKYQKNLKAEFDNPKTTPLMEDEREGFTGITFFPIDDNFKVQADFERMEDGKTIPFPTSAGKIKHYKEYGKAHFQLNEEDFELTLYVSDPLHPDYPNSIFLPFTDDTNGLTSYGGGRYMDLETTDIKNGKIILDFNKAYNPYCAYSKYYNCPIPPYNNYLETEINAGVSFDDEDL